MTARYCLRCTNIALVPLGEPTEEIQFYECPSCTRQYAKRKGKNLTFRWRHLISLPLYYILFDKDPMPRTKEIAQSLAKNRSKEELQIMISEIEEENAHPSQTVRDILDNPQNEEVCREFLGEIATCLRQAISH